MGWTICGGAEIESRPFKFNKYFCLSSVIPKLLQMRAAELERLPGSDWGVLYPSKESEEESEDRVRLVRLSDPLLSSSASSLPSEL